MKLGHQRREYNRRVALRICMNQHTHPPVSMACLPWISACYCEIFAKVRFQLYSSRPMALFIPGHNITTSLHTSFSADLLPRAGIHPAVIQTLGSTVSGWWRHNDQLEHRNTKRANRFFQMCIWLFHIMNFLDI